MRSFCFSGMKWAIAFGSMYLGTAAAQCNVVPGTVVDLSTGIAMTLVVPAVLGPIDYGTSDVLRIAQTAADVQPIGDSTSATVTRANTLLDLISGQTMTLVLPRIKSAVDGRGVPILIANSGLQSDLPAGQVHDLINGGVMSFGSGLSSICPGQ